MSSQPGRPWRTETRTGPYVYDVQPRDLVQMGVSNPESSFLVSLLIGSWISLLADSPLRGVCGPKPYVLVRSFHRDLLRSPIKDAILRYADLADRLMKNSTAYGDFTTTGDFLDEMKDTPVFKEYLHWFRTGDPEVLRFLLTFLLFGKKANYADSTLEATALRGWLEVEERIGQATFDSDIVRDLRLIVQAILGEDRGDVPFMGRHGPGSTAEGVRGLVAKSTAIKFHPRLDRAFFTHTLLSRSRREVAHDPLLVLPDGESWVTARKERVGFSTDVSRLKFVPKNVKTARSICMEPVSFMYFQQAYRYEYERNLARGPLRGHVDIHDQGINRSLAEYGSASSLVDTIDLSAASDSVSVELVRKIFPRTVLFKLLGTRTSRVELPDGTIRTVAKFAPMGSALCFPVQTTIYAAVVIRAYLIRTKNLCNLQEVAHKGPKALSDRLSKLLSRVIRPGSVGKDKTLNRFSVYGDDIICDYRVTDDVTHVLTSLGFSVNIEKSFTANQALRESCGGYYWLGDDVTPLRFAAKDIGPKLSAQSLLSVVALINRAGDMRFLSLRSFLINWLLSQRADHLGLSAKARLKYEKSGKFPVAFTDDREAFGIYTTNPRNEHLHKRWNKKLQRIEAKAVRCVAALALEFEELDSGKRRAPFVSDEYERQSYILWQRSALLRPDDADDLLAGGHSGDVVDARLQWRWVPTGE